MKPILSAILLCLASCAEYPIAIAVQGEHGTYSYSARQGIVISIQK